jgi:uncharacterized protein (TIGR02588 family)
MTPPRKTGVSKWEWIAASLSAAVVCAAIVVLLLHARRARTPPDLAVVVDSIATESAGFLVRFTVSNHGNTSAAEVPVHGELHRADGQDETAEVTFDFVPDGSKRQGGLMFRSDPRQGRLSVYAAGYREP